MTMFKLEARSHPSDFWRIASPLLALVLTVVLGVAAGVAAVLVASMKFNFLGAPLNLRYRGPNVIRCNAGFRKGEEMGRFEHGSTIIVFAPRGFALCEGIRDGARIRVGERLMHLPARTDPGVS